MNVLIRVDDYISFIGSPSCTVYSVDRDADSVTLLPNDGSDLLIDYSLSRLTDACTNLDDGVNVYIGKLIKWLPIPSGHVYYGFGYAPRVVGGYAYDGPNGFDGKNVIRDAKGNPVPLKVHNPAAYDIYMANPAKHYRFGG